MKPKLLIVDDEIKLLKTLEKHFIFNEYNVITASSANDALEKLNQSIDIVLLDINMPDMDGLTICKIIREFVSYPILFMTANTEDHYKIKGFSAGGDDYITKPFSIDELTARVSAHLRREKRQKTVTKVYFDKDFIIDYKDRSIYFKGKEIFLLKKEFDIIEVLSQNAGQIFDKERLYLSAWGSDGVRNNSVVSEHIRKIRAKFLEVGANQYIETVWGIGYKWIK